MTKLKRSRFVFFVKRSDWYQIFPKGTYFCKIFCHSFPQIQKLIKISRISRIFLTDSAILKWTSRLLNNFKTTTSGFSTAVCCMISSVKSLKFHCDKKIFRLFFARALRKNFCLRKCNKVRSILYGSERPLFSLACAVFFPAKAKTKPTREHSNRVMAFSSYCFCPYFCAYFFMFPPFLSLCCIRF